LIGVFTGWSFDVYIFQITNRGFKAGDNNQLIHGNSFIVTPAEPASFRTKGLPLVPSHHHEVDGRFGYWHNQISVVVFPILRLSLKSNATTP
jgi:hypothetical protein